MGEFVSEDDGMGRSRAIGQIRARRSGMSAARQETLKSVATAPAATGTAVVLLRSQV